VTDCIFCKIVAGQIPCTKVFENDAVLAFLDIAPAAEGHTLVIPKQHTERIDVTDPQTLTEIAKVLPAIAAAVQKATDADGYTVLCNNGAASGQAVPHVHFHIIPRKTRDGVIQAWKPLQPGPDRIRQMAEKITQNLTN
jgi:histidine triad (HIT) family protein